MDNCISTTRIQGESRDVIEHGPRCMGANPQSQLKIKTEDSDDHDDDMIMEGLSQQCYCLKAMMKLNINPRVVLGSRSKGGKKKGR